jgi:hypothetical protein
MPTLSKARRGTPTERNGGLLIDDDKDPLTALSTTCRAAIHRVSRTATSELLLRLVLRDGLRPPAVRLANIFPSTAPLEWAPVALYVALRHITRRPLGSPGVAFFRRDAVATIGWEDRDSDYSATSCDLLTRFGSSMLITVNRTPSVSSVRQITRHLRTSSRVICNTNSSGIVLARTPVICAPPFEKLLRMQGRAKLRSESWIVAGEFHSIRKFLRRSRGIRVFQLLLSNPLREKL